MSNHLMILMNQNLRNERKFKDRSNPLEKYSDLECIQRFRFDRQAISDICALLNDD